MPVPKDQTFNGGAFVADINYTVKSGRYGASSGGTDFGERKCKPGEIVTSIYGGAGTRLDSVNIGCSDGQAIGVGGVFGGHSYTHQGPFQKVNLRAGNRIDNLLGSGGNGGTWHEYACPAGTYLVGMHGRAGQEVDQLGFICGLDKKEFCLANLENDACRTIDTATLNKACALNMSATCKNRKNELDDEMVRQYCSTRLYDPFCACYRPAPAYIPDLVKGQAPCWNQECADSGYIPLNMRGRDCPNVKICTQDMKYGGDSNILTKNINIQDCRDTTVVPPAETPSTPGYVPPATPPYTGEPGYSDNPDDYSEEEETSYSALYWLLGILGALLVAIGLYKAFGKKEAVQQPSQQSSPPQTVPVYRIAAQSSAAQPSIVQPSGVQLGKSYISPIQSMAMMPRFTMV
jgi:hypothetical protein